MRYVVKDLTGQKFGCLTVIEQSDYRIIGKQKIVTWKCKCDCGNIVIVTRQCLCAGNTKSCGHLKKNGPRGKNSKNWKGCGDITGAMYSRIKRCARTRNLDFNLTIEYIWNLFVKQNYCCALTGICLQFGDIKSRVECTASLDRINSKNGYVIGNVQWVHKDINKMKQNLNEDDFHDFCFAVVFFKNLRKK